METLKLILAFMQQTLKTAKKYTNDVAEQMAFSAIDCSVENMEFRISANIEEGGN